MDICEKARIALYIGFAAGTGGAERLCWEEEKHLRQNGFVPIVVTHRLTEAGLMGYSPSHIEVVPHARTLLGQLLNLRATLRKVRPHLVIAQSHRAALALFLSQWPRPSPYIVHIHGTVFWFLTDNPKYALLHRNVFHIIRNSVVGHMEFIPAKRHLSPAIRVRIELEALLELLAIRRASHIITLTEQLRWEINQLYGRNAIVARGCLSSEMLTHTSESNAREKFGFTGHKIVLSVGRLDPRKRVALLIQAMPVILRSEPSALLVVGGTGEEEPRLRQLVDTMALGEFVRFIGPVAEDELMNIYSAADVFAFPSWTTSGITPYEALACGTKVVWTSEADEPVLNSPHVFVAEPTAHAFAQAIIQALNTEVPGKPDVSNYTWEKYFSTVIDEAVRPALCALSTGNGQTGL